MLPIAKRRECRKKLFQLSACLAFDLGELCVGVALQGTTTAWFETQGHLSGDFPSEPNRFAKASCTVQAAGPT